MDISSRIAKNTLSILFLALTSKVVRIMGFFAIAAALPTTELGQFSLALACVEFVTGLTEFGVDLVVIRRLALAPQDRSRYIGTSLKAKLLLSCIAYALAIGASVALGFGGYATVLTGLAGLSLFARAATNSLASPFQADLAMSRMVTLNLWSALTYLSLLTLSLIVFPSLSLLVLAGVASDFVLLALTFKTAQQKTAIDWTPQWPAIWALLVEAAPLGISALFVTAYFRVDTLILRRIAGLAAVGYYSVAYRATESLLLLATAYGNSLYPIFSARSEPGTEELAEMFRRNYRTVIAGSSLVCFLVSSFIEPLVARVAPRYQSSALPIAVLIWSTLFMFANAITGVTLNSLGRHRLFVRITAVNLVANLGLNLYLIPPLQILGACIATVLTEFVNFVQQAYLLRRVTGLHVHLTWCFPLAASAGVFLLRTGTDRSIRILVLILLPAVLTFQLWRCVRKSLASSYSLARGAE